MMKKIKEQSILGSLSSLVTNAVASSDSPDKTEALTQATEFQNEVGIAQREFGESETIIRRPKIKSNMKKLVSKTKLKKPIGKIYFIGKKETKEITGSGSSGGYEKPLFTEMTKKEVEEKWSQKYKDSIDCNNPKGFSQRAHCQGKKKKVDGKKTETKEATGSSSSGSYVTPAAWAKSTSKKDWRGKSKTQIPGGKFVQVKKKCKKFPYCNQGDINALKIFDSVMVKKAIKEVSDKYGIDSEVVKNIISYEISNNKLKK